MAIYKGNKKIAGLVRGEDISHATETHAGVIEIATQDEVNLGADGTKAVTPAKLKPVTDNLNDKIEEIRTAQLPNAVKIGNPVVNGSFVSGFSSADYYVFPFHVDLRNSTFQIDFCFTTGSDVQTQQNILDSRCGLALAIRNGKGLMALSSNGTTFNIGQIAGTINISANTVYYARVTWDKSKYATAISVDGVNYTEDMVLNSSDGLYPVQMFIGGAPYGDSTHPFSGIIDFAKSKLIVNGEEIWAGMNNAGLANKANVDLGNLSTDGEARFTEIHTAIAEQKQETIALKGNLGGCKFAVVDGILTVTYDDGGEN